GFLAAGLVAGVADAVLIFALVAEMERIGRHFRRRKFLEHARVEQRGETLLRTDAHVMAALRADVLRRDQVAMEDHLAAGRAFAPEILRRLRLVGHQAFDPGADEIGNPVHDSTLLPWTAPAKARTNSAISLALSPLATRSTMAEPTTAPSA